MPCLPQAETYLDAYISAGIGDVRKGPLFRSAIGKTGALAGKRRSRTDVRPIEQRLLTYPIVNCWDSQFAKLAGFARLPDLHLTHG